MSGRKARYALIGAQVIVDLVTNYSMFKVPILHNFAAPHWLAVSFFRSVGCHNENSLPDAIGHCRHFVLHHRQLYRRGTPA